jgi:plastocyanin
MRRRVLAIGLPLALPAAVLPGRAFGEPTLAEVRIKGNLFVPETLTIKPGTTVRWVNDERRTTHSVLFAQEGGFESERLFPGDSWTRRFDQPGRHPYTCGPHPEMKGLVIVQA